MYIADGCRWGVNGKVGRDLHRTWQFSSVEPFLVVGLLVEISMTFWELEEEQQPTWDRVGRGERCVMVQMKDARHYPDKVTCQKR